MNKAEKHQHLLEKEFDEINNYIRSFMTNLVSWYIFYCTASLTMLGATALILKENDNTPKTLIVIKSIILLALSTDCLAIILTISVAIFFFNMTRRMNCIVIEINKILNGSLKVPIKSYLLPTVTILMMLSLIAILVVWIHLFNSLIYI